MIRVSEAKPNGIAARALAASGLPIEIIRIDGGTQSRALLQDSVIEEYAAAIGEGVTFPPIIVFYDGADHWLADGFHRVRAYAAAGVQRVPADVRQGTRRDAILYSVGANETHGLRRTNDDKRRAVLTLLNDAEWAKWSDREIARLCAVGNKFVGDIRRTVTVSEHSEPSKRTYKTKHGTKATMNTSAIGKAAPQTKEDDEAVEATAQTAPPVKKHGGSMFIPEGANVVELCRAGIAMEADGVTVEKAAAKVGLSLNAYRVSRQIVLLSDNRDLSTKDTDTVRRAITVLVEDGQWGNAWEIAEPVAIKVWGVGYKVGLLEIAGKRIEQFERTFGIVMQSCTTTDEIDLPYLTAEQVRKALRQIGAARGALARFAERIKEIHE